MSISLVNAQILINAALNFLSLNSCIRSTYRDFYFNELDANLHYITYFSNLIGINWPGFIASLLWIIFLNWKQEIFIQVTMCNPPERNTKWPRKNVCTVLKLLFKTQKTKDDITRWDIWRFGRFERCSEDFPALSQVVGCR